MTIKSIFMNIQEDKINTRDFIIMVYYEKKFRLQYMK